MSTKTSIRYQKMRYLFSRSSCTSSVMRINIISFWIRELTYRIESTYMQPSWPKLNRAVYLQYKKLTFRYLSWPFACMSSSSAANFSPVSCTFRWGTSSSCSAERSEMSLCICSPGYRKRRRDVPMFSSCIAYSTSRCAKATTLACAYSFRMVCTLLEALISMQTTEITSQVAASWWKSIVKLAT